MSQSTELATTRPVDHATALARAMTGAPMIGDPRINDVGGDVLTRRACLYATEMLRGRGAVPTDLSDYDAVFLPPATVVLVRSDPSQAELARFTIPQRVMLFTGTRPSISRKVPPMTIEAGSAAERLVIALKPIRFKLNNEKALQAEMAQAFDRLGIEAEREVRLGPGDIIDFLVGDVGLEVKTKGQKKAIFRQCERYCDHDRIKALVVATNVAMGFPREIGGKPVYVLPLGKAWL